MQKIEERKSLKADGLTFKKAAVRTVPSMAATPVLAAAGGPLSAGWSSVLDGVGSAVGGVHIEGGEAVEALRRSVARLEKRSEEMNKDMRRQLDEVLLQQSQLSDKVPPPPPPSSRAYGEGEPRTGHKRATNGR